MDTTAKTPYTEEDGQDGTVINMILGTMLGIAIFVLKMLTHSTALNTVVPVGGLTAVGIHMVAYAISGSPDKRSTYNLLGTAGIVAFCNLSYLGLSAI